MIRATLCSIALLASLSLGTPVEAQTFSVKLGDRQLGVLTFAGGAQKSVLRSTLSNTPLGVFNGRFDGMSQKQNDGSQAFVGVSKSSRKNRQVRTVIKNGRAVETRVTPEKELTDLSNIALVPKGITDPVLAIAELVNARNGCPGVIRIYDGRRAIALTPQGTAREGAILRCEVAYRVTHGPGHLSPLRISSASMQLAYDTSGQAQRLQQIRLGSGVFNLLLDRVK